LLRRRAFSFVRLRLIWDLMLATKISFVKVGQRSEHGRLRHDLWTHRAVDYQPSAVSFTNGSAGALQLRFEEVDRRTLMTS
jgi:hypothetical protein